MSRQVALAGAVLCAVALIELICVGVGWLHVTPVFNLKEFSAPLWVFIAVPALLAALEYFSEWDPRK